VEAEQEMKLIERNVLEILSKLKVRSLFFFLYGPPQVPPTEWLGL
jgi:hypothetical protein